MTGLFLISVLASSFCRGGWHFLCIINFLWIIHCSPLLRKKLESSFYFSSKRDKSKVYGLSGVLWGGDWKKILGFKGRDRKLVESCVNWSMNWRQIKRRKFLREVQKCLKLFTQKLSGSNLKLFLNRIKVFLNHSMSEHSIQTHYQNINF
jgi:hypothetical protein